MKVDIKLLNDNSIVPVYGSTNAAGADLYACVEEETLIYNGETKLIPTGISLAIPEGYVGLVFARSGLATKEGLAPANKVGVIDSDYRGEVMVALYNQSDVARTITPGERIAQLVIVPYVAAKFNVVTELPTTDRGSGGFGSTGTN